MATIPIHNPNSPFLGQIPGGLRPGVTIRIKGVMHGGYGTRFNFHLQVGPALSPRDDCALHMSIRPDHQCIVRNSMENGNYGTEERFGGCPIQYGQPFDIAIVVDHATYNISINGVHFCHFNHRLPLSRVQFIALGDGCTLHYIGHEMGGAPIHRPIMTAPSVPSYPAMPYPNHSPAYPPAGGVQVLPIPVAPPPPPYSPAPPIYPSHQANQHATAYGFLPPQMPMQQAFVSQTNFAASDISHQPMQQVPPTKHQSFGALGANLAAMKNTLQTKKKPNKKALGIAAGVGAGLGALGLGGYAISRAINKAADGGSGSDSE